MCPTIYYHADAFGCGVCENITSVPFVHCTELPFFEGQMCTFTVQTIACNGLIGDKSKPVSILLRSNSESVYS